MQVGGSYSIFIIQCYGILRMWLPVTIIKRGVAGIYEGRSGRLKQMWEVMRKYHSSWYGLTVRSYNNRDRYELIRINKSVSCILCNHQWCTNLQRRELGYNWDDNTYDYLLMSSHCQILKLYYSLVKHSLMHKHKTWGGIPFKDATSY